MAEVQKTPIGAGEMTQRFIEFVMMQAQQAAVFLGRGPRAASGQTEVNLDFARLFINQLEMIREKTKGNLTKEEEDILTGVLADLQLAYVEVSAMEGNFSAATNPPGETVSPAPEPSQQAAAPESQTELPSQPAPPPETESKKRFTKSYG